MANVSLRGIDDHMKKLLKVEAAKSGISVNSLILRYVKKGIGLDPVSRVTYSDLDSLAGTWSDAENDEFMAAVRDLERIDEDMWK